MRLLLDTNIFIFWAIDEDSLDRNVLALISSDTRFPFYENQGLKLIRNER